MSVGVINPYIRANNIQPLNTAQNPIMFTSKNDVDTFSYTSEYKSDIRESYEEIKSQQGVIGKLWDGFKNLLHLKSGSNQVEKVIEQAENGEITEEEAQEAIDKYEAGQKMCVDVAADIVSGIISMSAFILAVPTGGASIAVGLAASTAVGAGVKIGIKAGDALVTGKDYNAKDLLYDTATGAINGLIAPVTNGLGNCVTKTVGKKLGLEIIEQGGKQAAKEVVKQTASQGIKSAILSQSVDVAGGTVLKRAAALGAGMALDGALGGASDNMVRAALNGDNVVKAGVEGAIGGLILSPIIGGGMRVAGKAASKFKNTMISNTVDNVDMSTLAKKTDDTITDIVDSSVSDTAVNIPEKNIHTTPQPSSKCLAAEQIQDELFEENPYMDAWRNRLYEEYGAYSLTGEGESIITAKNIGSPNNASLAFKYDDLSDLSIQNLTLATNKKGIRGSSIFSKTNKKFMSNLKEAGIDTVIDLRAESNIERSIQQCDRAGLKYVHFPIDYDQKLNIEQINSFKELLPSFFDAMDEGKFYIGCNEGTNRTDVAFGLNYLFNPKETVSPIFESTNPQKSIQMTKRIAKAILQQSEDGTFLHINDDFVKSLGWDSLQSFMEEYSRRTKILNTSNLKI